MLAQVKSGEIPMDKVPYMQRGGAWDNSDLVTKKGQETMKKKTEKVVFNNKISKGVEKKAWSKLDKEYAAVRFAVHTNVLAACSSLLGKTSLMVLVHADAVNKCLSVSCLLRYHDSCRETAPTRKTSTLLNITPTWYTFVQNFAVLGVLYAT